MTGLRISPDLTLPLDAATGTGKSNARTLGLIDYPSPGMVAAEPVLFLEQG